MIKENFNVSTSNRSQMIDISDKIQKILSGTGVKEGICTVFIPHTTAGVTINENADPSVEKDINRMLDIKIPWSHSSYSHAEGNSAAHVKSSLIGCSQTLIIEGGRLKLGTWQSVFFCEFDGPRRRKVWVRIN